MQSIYHLTHRGSIIVTATNCARLHLEEDRRQQFFKNIVLYNWKVYSKRSMATQFMRPGSLTLTAPKKDGIKEIKLIAGFSKQQKNPAFEDLCCSRQQDTQMAVKKKFSSCPFENLPDLVDKYRGLRIDLKSPNSYKLRITGLDGTVYWGCEEMLEAWGELYLPQPETMAVMGAIDNVPSLAEGLQLIVVVDSQGKVYFYESEVLHLVARSVKDFLDSGAASPPMKSFEYGQHCAPEAEEEHLKSADIQLIQEATRSLVQTEEKVIMDSLNFLAGL